MKLTTEEITANIKALSALLKESGADALYIPSFDQNISEYVPLWNNLRYYVTGFMGSTADTLLLSSGEIHLFVDGRYHLQADEEVKSPLVKVEKLAGNIRIFQAVLDLAQEKSVERLCYIPERTPYQFQVRLQNGFQALEIAEAQVRPLVNFKAQEDFPEVFPVDEKLIGQSVKDRLERVGVRRGEAYFLSAIDDIAWVTNLRGYHLPFLSSFIAKALITKSKIHLFVKESIKFKSGVDSLIEVHHYTESYSEVLAKIIKDESIGLVCFDKSFSTLADYSILRNQNIKIEENEGLTPVKAIKFDVELPEFERIFNQGSQAIYKTMKWVKESIRGGEKISEKDLYEKTSECYKAEGGVTQSFNTISGVGENGAIVHYGDPKSDRIIQRNDLVLLDSGGYFESGLATDTTRTFLADSSAIDHPLFEDYKNCFTLVLKSQIQVESAVFPEGTMGCALDMLSRQVLYQYGLDYAHGLGHGVGVHVHEPGVRLSSLSTLPMKKGQLVSIEPGLYFSNKFGIRHENIAIVEKHPDYEGFLRFRTLVFLGFDEVLVDRSLLTDQENKYLNYYLEECKKRNVSF